jgi:hypothetical protein
LAKSEQGKVNWEGKLMIGVQLRISDLLGGARRNRTIILVIFIVACQAKAVGVGEHIVAMSEEGPDVVILMDGLNYEALIEVSKANNVLIVSGEELNNEIGVSCIQE